MKLSDAMVLGDTLRKRNASMYLDKDRYGNYCGCAIGGAFLAIGITDSDEMIADREHWPWLSDKANLGSRYRTLIGCGIDRKYPSFLQVETGECTFEQLVEYVRSIEPECGECNSFKCTCKKNKGEEKECGALLQPKVEM